MTDKSESSFQPNQAPPVNITVASALSPPELFHLFDVDVNTGLQESKARKLLTKYGPNALVEADEEPLWRKYSDTFFDPSILMLLASAVISLLWEQYDDAFSISIAVIIVVTIAFLQERESEKSLQELKRLMPRKCRCMRNGEIDDDFLGEDLVPGDVVFLETGDRVAADLRLIEAHDLSADESSFTGEAEPAIKTANYLMPSPTSNASLSRISHRGYFRPRRSSSAASTSQRSSRSKDVTPPNLTLMGSIIKSGNGKAIVIATGNHTVFGDIFQNMANEDSPLTPLQESMSQLTTQLSTYSIVCIGILTAIGLLQGRKFQELLTTAVSLAVAAIPEGLPVVVSVTLALGVMRMSKGRVIVKKLPTVETLGCCDVICCDKTGTLTLNEMTTVIMQAAKGEARNVYDETYNELDPVQLRLPDCDKINRCGTLCNNSRRDNHVHSGMPTESAILRVAYRCVNVDELRSKWARIDEVAFTHERKYMAVTCRNDDTKEEIHFMKGAVEVVLEFCSYYELDGEKKPISHDDRLEFKNSADEIGSKGLRIVGFCEGSTNQDMTWLGIVGILDPPRPNVKSTLEELHSCGVTVKMLTGDSQKTAVSIAESIGLITDKQRLDMSGTELENSSLQELAEVIDEVAVFYRVKPKHKLKIIKALQYKEHVVAMTGDGVNDAIALKVAEIGISMGKNGTDAAKEASDMVLVDDDFGTIISAIEEGKCIFHNIRNFIRFQISTSVAALLLISLATSFDIPMPLNPMQILLINIIMDGPPALSLGVEPVDHEVLKQPPRNTKEPMITRSVIIQILMSALIMTSGTFYVFYKELKNGEITKRCTTMTFSCFVLFDMFNALSCRSEKKSVLTIGLFSNKNFLIAACASILGLVCVVHLPAFQQVFGTEKLNFQDWSFLILLSSSVLLFSEIRKLFSR